MTRVVFDPEGKTPVGSTAAATLGVAAAAATTAVDDARLYFPKLDRLCCRLTSDPAGGPEDGPDHDARDPGGIRDRAAESIAAGEREILACLPHRPTASRVWLYSASSGFYWRAIQKVLYGHGAEALQDPAADAIAIEYRDWRLPTPYEFERGFLDCNVRSDGDDDGDTGSRGRFATDVFFAPPPPPPPRLPRADNDGGDIMMKVAGGLALAAIGGMAYSFWRQHREREVQREAEATSDLAEIHDSEPPTFAAPSSSSSLSPAAKRRNRSATARR